MRILAQNAINEVESSKELLKIELANAAAQFNKLEQRQKATQGLAVKRSGFPIWLTGVLTVGALAIGVFIGAVVVRPDFESPSTEQAP